MSDQEINAAIEKLAFKHQLAVEHLTESQLANAIKQAILCGDFQRQISTDSQQSVTYAPFRKLKDVERERDEARELAEAYKEYAQVLGVEINDMVIHAHVHGLKFSRFEQSKVLHEKIKQLEAAK